MREQEHFEYFKNQVIPYLYSTIRDRDIRIWSTGCYSGEEPYTLAMIMQDYFAEEKSFWDKKILASDISVKVLEKVIDGIYTVESLEKVSERWNDEIKSEVVFRTFNLMDDFPFRRKFHVIF